MVVFTLYCSAAPFDQSLCIGVCRVVDRQTASTVFVRRFRLGRCRVDSVHFPTFEALGRAGFGLFQLTNDLRFDTTAFFSVLVVPCDFRLTQGGYRVFRDVRRVVVSLAISWEFAVRRRFRFFDAKCRVGEFGRVFFVIPVAGSVGAKVLCVRPSIPRRLVYVREVFESARNVYRAAAAVVLRAAVVYVHVQRSSFRASQTSAIAYAQTFAPVVGPAGCVFGDGKVLVIVVDANVRLFLSLVDRYEAG